MYLIIPDDQTIYSSSDDDEPIEEIGDEDNRTNNELLEEVLRQLSRKKYDEVHDLLIAAADNFADIYRELFRAVIEEYDKDFTESGISDPILENVLILLKSYGTTKDKLAVLLECSDLVNSWKAFMLLGSFLEEMMPEMKDFSEHFIRDIRGIYLPSWIERFEKNVVLNHSDEQLNREYFSNLEADYLDENYNPALPDASSDLFLAAVFMFLRIFTLSMSKNYKLLNELFDKVLACTYIQSDYMEAFIMKLDEIYKFSDQRLPLNTLIFVNSLKSRFYSLPQVFAPEYYLKLALGPLRYSLHISTSNMFNIGYVVLVLRNCLLSVENESIGRNQWTFFLEFLADFLMCCEECTLCEVRVVCMDTFKMFLSKFESIAQVLIIRKLFSMIRKDEIQRKNLHKVNIYDEKSLKFEAQLLAWIIDLFRSKLNYEVFRRELGYFWCDIINIRYPCLSDGLQYYLSVFIFAQEQALRRMNPELVLNIYKHYLQPLQSQISDWTELVKVEERQISRGSLEVPPNQLSISMERLEMESRRQHDVIMISFMFPTNLTKIVPTPSYERLLFEQDEELLKT
uniref:RNA polymerase I-specific transcription initiation factor RRN3 n=1 Tax=Loa loa TaxID=7209 RepID=A0A1I7VM63_LOALO